MSDAPISFPVRLQKYLAACGLGSRRACEAYIADGDVSINGEPVTTPGFKVEEGDVVRYRSEVLQPVPKAYYILNKPAGYLSSNADPHHDRFARDLIHAEDRDSLFHVGRLDLESTGLIIYTNDGAFAQRVGHPSYEVEKEYVVTVKEDILKRDFDRVLTEGIIDDGEQLRIRAFTITDSHTVRLVLGEGKNREIRRICRSLGYRIRRLHRIRIGQIRLGALPEGSYRPMTEEEKASILRGNRT